MKFCFKGNYNADYHDYIFSFSFTHILIPPPPPKKKKTKQKPNNKKITHTKPGH